MHTCYAPVRRSPPVYCYTALPLDLHVLGLPLAFILSQDQTLHCMSIFLSRACRAAGPAGLTFPARLTARPLAVPVCLNDLSSAPANRAGPLPRSVTESGCKGTAFSTLPPNFSGTFFVFSATFSVRRWRSGGISGGIMWGFRAVRGNGRGIWGTAGAAGGCKREGKGRGKGVFCAGLVRDGGGNWRGRAPVALRRGSLAAPLPLAREYVFLTTFYMDRKDWRVGRRGLICDGRRERVRIFK